MTNKVSLVSSAQNLFLALALLFVVLGSMAFAQYVQQQMFSSANAYTEFYYDEDTANVNVDDQTDADRYIEHVATLNLAQQGCGCPSCCAAAM